MFIKNMTAALMLMAALFIAVPVIAAEDNNADQDNGEENDEVERWSSTPIGVGGSMDGPFVDIIHRLESEEHEPFDFHFRAKSGDDGNRASVNLVDYSSGFGPGGLWLGYEYADDLLFQRGFVIGFLEQWNFTDNGFVRFTAASTNSVSGAFAELSLRVPIGDLMEVHIQASEQFWGDDDTRASAAIRYQF